MCIAALLFALVFEFINGFHDTANVVATSIATRALSPRMAILLASLTNLMGALIGTAVAATVMSSIVVKDVINLQTITAALIGAIVWNLLTWWKGLPSSSSHALIGSLIGSTLATTHGDVHAVYWNIVTETGAHKGVFGSVVIPMILSPLIGFIISLTLIKILKALLVRSYDKTFKSLQVISASSMGIMHGLNDAQKTMGIITLSLTIAVSSNSVPSYLQWLTLDLHQTTVPLWVKMICAFTMAIGTAVGGWKIIRTMGFKMVHLTTREGFVAETSSATTIGLCSMFGMPVSTTHNITASIIGAGTGSNPDKVSYSLVNKILLGWILTLPCAALCGALCVLFLSLF